MKVEPKKVTIRELAEGFKDLGDEGVTAFNGRLDVRPPYQREFIYNEKQRNLVIDTVRNGLPLNIMYWNKKPDGSFEILDGQQRSLAICKYIKGEFSVDSLYFHSLTPEEREKIYNYELSVYVCEGTEKERIRWFETVNIAGAVLTHQEIRNSVFVGPWLADAKRYFSRVNIGAHALAKDYVNGNPKRQDILETAIKWITVAEGAGDSIDSYMSRHQYDSDALPLWNHFKEVIDWAGHTFPFKTKYKKGVDWNSLYLEYKDKKVDPSEFKKKSAKLLKDSEIKNKSGIFEYLLSGDEQALDLRTFDDDIKEEILEKQNYECPICAAAGNHKKYTLDEVEADHVIPWSKGGRTTVDNCQVLCRKHNRKKSNK